MEEYEKRVVEEERELLDKHKRLLEFMQTDAFKNLSVEECKRLHRQALLMELYVEVLIERTNAFAR